MARVAETPEHERECGQHPPDGEWFVPLPIESERLLERRSRLLVSALLLGGVRPALEQRSPLGMAGRGERERFREARLRAGDVERERPFAGESEVAAC